MFEVDPKSVSSCFKNYKNFFLLQKKLESVPIHSKSVRTIPKCVRMYPKNVPLTTKSIPSRKI